MNIIGHRNIYFTISGILIVAAAAAIVIFGFREGIDFTGGSLWQFTAGNSATLSQVESVVKSASSLDAKVTFDSTNGSYLARMSVLDESQHQKAAAAVKNAFPQFQELSFQSIGPTVSGQLRKNALIAIGLVLVGISLYIAFAFRRVSYPVTSWRYGFITLLTLFHDVAIPAGMLSVLGHLGRVEVDTNFIVALLVVMGFSVHDTIVVFDRIRENLMHNRERDEFGAVVNRSVNQTLARSINTSLTLILVLLALYFTGPATLRYFILTLLVGVTTGIYSSVFIASPALLFMRKK